MQIGGVPDVEDAWRNFNVLEQLGVEPGGEEDAKIVDYIREYRQMQPGAVLECAPDFSVVKEYFERDDQVDVVSRMGELKGRLHLIRTNFYAVARSYRDEQDIKKMELHLRDASNIIRHGRNLQVPVEGEDGEMKKVLRGLADMRRYMLDVLLDSPEVKAQRRTMEEAMEEAEELMRMDRVPTSFASLDDAMRGGLPVRKRLVCIAGPPSTGKTSLAVTMAHRWLVAGHPVAFLCVDEGAVGVAGRIAVCGARCNVHRLESKDKKVSGPEWAKAHKYVKDMPAFIKEDGTVEQLVQEFETWIRQKGLKKPGIVVIDSLQTARSAASGKSQNERGRVTSVTVAAKKASQKFLTVATSEVNRGFYGRAEKADQTTDMAAAKESGKIEYDAQTLLVLRGVEGDDTLVDVGIPKNRGFRKAPFRLSFDQEAMSYREVDRPSASLEKTQRDDKEREAVYESIASKVGITREESLSTLRSKGSPMGSDRWKILVASLGARVHKGSDRKWYAAKSLTQEDLFS